MRALILGLSVVVFGVLTAGPASAYDWERIHWKCQHGDEYACHLIKLHHECEDGNRHACHELERE